MKTTMTISTYKKEEKKKAKEQEEKRINIIMEKYGRIVIEEKKSLWKRIINKLIGQK